MFRRMRAHYSKAFIFVLFILFVFTCAHSYGQPQDNKEEEALFVAKKAFEDGFYEVSIGLLERFLKNYPDSGRRGEVELLIARSLFQQNKYVEALVKLEGLLNQGYASGIKDAVLYWLAEANFKGNSFSKAASYYKRIIDDFPNSAYISAAYYSLGWCLFQEEKFEDALGLFKIVEERYAKESQAQDAAFKIIECLYNLKDYANLKEKAKVYLKISSRDSVHLAYLYFYLAEADYYLNNFTEAISEYTKVISSSPDVKLQALSRLGMCWSYLKLKRYADSEKVLSEIKTADLEQRSQDIFMLARAILLSETNRMNEAKAAYDKLLNSSSDPLILFEAYFGKANALYNLASYNEAIRVYRLALEKQWPASVSTDLLDKLHYSLAWAYLKQGEFKEGIKEFQKIVKTTDDKIIKVSALCQIGDAYQDSGDYTKAQETYNTIAKEYPDSFYNDYVQYQLGVTLLKSSNYDGAVLALSVLKTNFPESKLLDDAFYALGLAYFQKQDYNASREVFERFQDDFRDSPLKSQALYLLGTSLFNLGKFNEAIAVFENIIKKFNQDTDLVQKAEYEIADCFYQKDEEQEALKRFKALRTKYPDSTLTAEVIWWLGEYYYRHNDLDLSRRYFTSLIQDFPHSSLVRDAYYVLGSIYAEEGKFEEAIASFKKVIEGSRADSAGKAAIAIGDIYLKGNKVDMAVSSYKDVLKEYPNLAHIIYPKMADIFFKTGNYNDALLFYRKSLDVVPIKEMAFVQFKIGEVLQAQNLLNEAVEEYLKVPYLHGEDNTLTVKALLRVAQIYESRENFKEALVVYKKVVSMEVEEAKYAQERIEWITSNTKSK